MPLAEKTQCEKFAKKWSHAYAGEEISTAPDLTAFSSVVPQSRLVERYRHKVGERNRAARRDFFL